MLWCVVDMLRNTKQLGYVWGGGRERGREREGGEREGGEGGQILREGGGGKRERGKGEGSEVRI